MKVELDVGPWNDDSSQAPGVISLTKGSLVCRPSYFRSAGCIASPAHGKEGLETLARFSCVLCTLEEFA